MAKNTYGTGCFALMNIGASGARSRHRLLTTVASRRGACQYALEGGVFMGGATIQWLRDGLGIIERSADVEALAASVPDTGDVYLVPAFAGLGAPQWDAAARGTIVGLTRGSNRAHLARAALESIAFQTADLIEAMQMDAGHALAELRVDGGAARNDLLLQFQADLLGVPVLQTREHRNHGIRCGLARRPGSGILAIGSRTRRALGAREALRAAHESRRGRRPTRALEPGARAFTRLGSHFVKIQPSRLSPFEPWARRRSRRSRWVALPGGRSMTRHAISAATRPSSSGCSLRRRRVTPHRRAASSTNCSNCSASAHRSEVAAAQADRKTRVERFFPALGLDVPDSGSAADAAGSPSASRTTSACTCAPQRTNSGACGPMKSSRASSPASTTWQGICRIPAAMPAYGYVMAYLLSEMVPERRDALLRRADEFARQRMVCGVHFRSDIEAGRAGARWLEHAFNESAEYRRDLSAAARELRAALRLPPLPQ